MSKLQFCQATIGEISVTIQSCLTSDAAEIQRVSVVAISGIQHRVTKTVDFKIKFFTLNPFLISADYIANRTCCA